MYISPSRQVVTWSSPRFGFWQPAMDDNYKPPSNPENHNNSQISSPSGIQDKLRRRATGQMEVLCFKLDQLSEALTPALRQAGRQLDDLRRLADSAQKQLISCQTMLSELAKTRETIAQNFKKPQ